MPRAELPSSPLLDHLETLYPLARIVAGPEEADQLLVQVYERAMSVPLEDRPQNAEGWLLQLLLDVHDERTRADVASNADGKTSRLEDSFRHHAAQQVMQAALPPALAACSPEERFLLMTDVLETDEQMTVDQVAQALEISPRAVRNRQEDARRALQTQLFEVVSEPKQTLLKESLSEEMLARELRALFTDPFPPVPSSLRAQIRSVLKAHATAQTSSDDRESESQTGSISPLTYESWGINLRSALIGILILLVITALGIGLSHLNPVSSPTSTQPGLVSYSAENVEHVRQMLVTSNSQEARSFVQSTWNRRITLPSLQTGRLEGVGQFAAEDGVTVPVLLYTMTDDSTRISVFVYNYALVDRLRPRAPLSANLRNQLAAAREMHSVDGGLLWRQADDIYVAVPSSPDSTDLRSHLRPTN